MSLKYFIKTYGCQMNVADSDKLAGVLESAGHTRATNAKQADIVLINTCVVRQNAEDRAAWYITSAKGLKNSNPNVKIIVCGCMVSEPGRNVKKSFPHVDLFVPPNSLDLFKAFLGEISKSEARNPKELLNSKFEFTSKFGIRHSNFVSIMTGCNNFCSYCVVPYVRGREYSRPMDEVLAEIKGLIDQGVTDITLLGQNVNSYKYGLANLLMKIKLLFPLARGQRERGLGGEGLMHFLTSHPKDLSDEIIQAVAKLPFVAKEFFLPLQSGDDVILKKMNRGYTLDYYLDRVKKIRSLMPNASIITDLMVGFPGETEEQFQNTLNIVEQVKFNAINMFAFSARPNTAAALLPDQLPEDVKQARLNQLIQLNRKLLA